MCMPIKKEWYAPLFPNISNDEFVTAIQGAEKSAKQANQKVDIGAIASSAAMTSTTCYFSGPVCDKDIQKLAIKR